MPDGFGDHIWNALNTGLFTIGSTPVIVVGMLRVMAAYLWEIHTALGEAGIEIPFPQRDLYLRSMFGLKDEQARQWLERSRGSGAGS
jgi:small-conductance mechanosensitive channel